VANRLLEVIQFVSEGPAAFYRDIAKAALQLACNHPEGPPRSSSELLRRLDYEFLLDAHGATSAVLSLPRDKVGQVRLRYEAFFGQLGCALDGDWSWDDTDTAYLLLDSVALGEDCRGAASLLFADFAHYFSQRKPKECFATMVIDEFSAIAGASDLALKVEQARGFNTALVLVPQTPSGMGGEIQRQRILGSVETVIAHAFNEPQEVSDLAGCKRVMELSQRYGEGLVEYEGFARQANRPTVDPDEIRSLETGTAWVIRRGRAVKVAVGRAPNVARLDLPEAVPLDRPLRAVEVAPPKQISYLDDGPEDG
jgi:hypothetical protein